MESVGSNQKVSPVNVQRRRRAPSAECIVIVFDRLLFNRLRSCQASAAPETPTGRSRVVYGPAAALGSRGLGGIGRQRPGAVMPQKSRWLPPHAVGGVGYSVTGGAGLRG